MAIKSIFVAGHNGMVGSALIRQLSRRQDVQLITANRSELDLCDQKAVADFFASTAIDEVYLAAAKVGGILANSIYSADFIYENLMIECNVIHSAHKANIQKLLFLGSSCIYPKLAQQPMTEEALLTGALESTNEPYAVAKIAGLKLCESYNRQYGRDYRSVMPTNLYGINDNFHPENSHVIPALLRRFHDAKHANTKEVIVWGTGLPMREFMFIDEMAAASLHVMELDSALYKTYTQPGLSHINIGTGVDYTISDVAKIIANVIGYKGTIVFDSTKPDGAPRKLMDISKLKKIGWKSSITLEDGLKTTYQWFLKNVDSFRT